MKTILRAFLSVLSLLFCVAAFGQNATAPPPSAPTPKPLFAVSTQALGIHIGGQTVPGTDEIGSINIKNDALGGDWWLQSDNVLFSSACTTCTALSGQLYLGGTKYYSHYLANLAGGTGISGNTPYFHAAIGVSRNSPTVGSVSQHIAGMFDAGFDYNVNGTFSLGPRAGALLAHGFGPTCVPESPCKNQGSLGWFVSASLQVNLAKIVH